MTNSKDPRFYIGAVFGSLTLLGRVRENPNAHANIRKRWRVRCVCKKEFTVPEFYLVRPKPKTHCGCLRKTIKTTSNNEYRIWLMMLQRTTNPKHVSFKDYGGRGITVCSQWSDPKTGFSAFLTHIGARPSKQHTVERINNDEGYSPLQSNGKLQVKWALPIEQAQNKRPRKVNTS